ncbi:cytidylate kinase-like family protein [Cellulosilyticum sp. I15G10I2]|uniref:cytidylate kinase-like family protein n=1 Tax=Cellulosilyticum sp. I15G10I2 TaxID=1892843 RepID=UPI00085C2511|nr:cytidylate kinase-like family protein [Cellulosilyticum sp. I15G10I2]
MRENQTYVITISRQLGSGGSYLGQKIAELLDIKYVDREILLQGAEKMANQESFWMSFVANCSYSWPYVPPSYTMIAEDRLHDKFGTMMQRVAKEHNCVIVGRCAGFILSKHQKTINLFLYADKEWRIKRVQELHGLTEKEARKAVGKNDSERANYHYLHTGEKWRDATQYDLCIETSKVGLDKAEQIVINYIKSRLEE